MTNVTLHFTSCGRDQELRAQRPEAGLYEADDRSKLSAELVDRIAIILAALDEAAVVEDLDRPSFRLHLLKGDLKGRWSVTVRANWRIIFRFEDGDAYEVNFLDYH